MKAKSMSEWFSNKWAVSLDLPARRQYLYGDAHLDNVRNHAFRSVASWCCENGVGDVIYPVVGDHVVFVHKADATLFFLAHA
jgi:hypothetical protein